MIMIDLNDHEMISFLQQYLTIDTSHPDPDYTAACALFRAQAEADGFLYNEIILPSGKPVIIITHTGTDATLPSLILNHHMDVVPALNTEKWIAPPFAAVIDNGIIIGRGVQDMKGVGAVHYYALKALYDAGIQLARTVHIVAVPDEEIGGFTGTQQFVETAFFKTMNCGFVIDEGVASGDETTVVIKVTERKPLQIQITVTGLLAHGSKLNAFNAIHELVRLLHTIITHHHAEQKKSATHAEGLLLSMNITSLLAGVHNNNQTSFNMVPDSATATVDIRVPPTMKVRDAVDFIEQLLQKHTNSSYTVHATVPDQADEDVYQTQLYNALVKTVKNYGMQSRPLFFEGSSDLRFYKKLKLDGVGFTPFTTHDNIHGTNESLPIADLIQGKNIMALFLKDFCTITGEH